MKIKYLSFCMIFYRDMCARLPEYVTWNVITYFIVANIPLHCNTATYTPSFYIKASYQVQKQSSVDVLWKKCFEKFRKIHKKTPVSASLFQKSCRPRLLLNLKRDSHSGVLLEFCEILKNTFFHGTLASAAFWSTTRTE